MAAGVSLRELVEAHRPGHDADPCTHALYCLVGLGTPGLRGRLEIDDEAFLYYGGHFAHFPRSASALGQILGDYFGTPIVESGREAGERSDAMPAGFTKPLYSYPAYTPRRPGIIYPQLPQPYYTFSETFNYCNCNAQSAKPYPQ